MTTLAKNTDAILASEQGFFDLESSRLTDSELVMSPRNLRRYKQASLRPTNIAKDTLFSLVQPLAGKHVLEFGCGTGNDSCHLANCGARVTAFDLSPVSIEKARRRAEIHGLSDRVQFDVKAAGNLGYPASSFDLVIGFAILHHLHQDLRGIYSEISRVLKPSGSAYFIEPVANSGALRFLRPLTPVSCYATPDERQLLYSDFEIMKDHGFRKIEYHHFYCLDRLQRIIGGWASKPLRAADYYLQRMVPQLKRFYGTVLVVAHR